MKRILFLFIILSIFSSCRSNHTPDGRITEEERSINNFITLEVSSGIQVEFTHSDKSSIIIETYENVLPYVITENLGTTLKIYLNPNCPFDEIPFLDIKISSNELYIIKVTEASEVKLLSNITTDYFEVHLDKGSSFSTGDKDTLRVVSLLTKIENGSTCTITGTSEKLVAGLADGSTLSAANFVSKEVDAKVNLWSLMEISVSEKYLFIADGASIIEYTGSAKGTIHANGGSRIDYLGLKE